MDTTKEFEDMGDWMADYGTNVWAQLHETTGARWHSAWEADRRRLGRLESAVRNHFEWSGYMLAQEIGDALAPSDTSQANPSPMSPAGIDILRTRVCPECESVIQSGINRCPRCSGE